MKRSIAAFILFSMLFVLLTACQSPGPEQDLGDTYVPESDYQYSFLLSSQLGGPPISESENSYYFLHNQFLYAKDKKTGKCVPLCNKPDCTHDEQAISPDGTPNCNAFFGTVNNMAYYDGKLYVFTPANGVYEIDSGGSTRSQLLKPKGEMLGIMVHRGYLYVSFSDFLSSPESYSADKLESMSCHVERYRLDHWDGKPEMIYEKKGEYSQISTMYAYGNRIWFSVVSADDSYNLIFNILDGSIAEEDEAIASGTIAGEAVLVFEGLKGITSETTMEERHSLKQKNLAVLKDWNGKTIQNTEIPQTYDALCAWGDRIAADNYWQAFFQTTSSEERGVRFYDQDGKFIREIKTGNEMMPSLGMNEDYFFYMKSSENGEDTELWAIDLHRLDDPDLQGEPFFAANE